MDIKFNSNPNESILYHARASRKWYALASRIGIGIVEVMAFILLSLTAFTSLTASLLAALLPAGAATIISRIVFQGVAPLLVLAWFAEDTARIFSSELILTDQRIWTRGIPYAWTSRREIALSDIKSITSRRDALFLHLRSTKKTLVFSFSDSKLIEKTYSQFTEGKDLK